MSQSTNSNGRGDNASDVNITELVLTNFAGKTYNCMEIFSDVQIYESIFSNNITGSMGILDKFNAMKNLPLIGNEKLKIVFETPNKKKVEKTFKVYDISFSERVPGRRETILNFHFATPEFFENNTKTVSKSYQKKKFSEIVKSIFDEYLKTGDSDLKVVETTQPKTSIVVPNWSPLKAINWIASKSKERNNCDYFFYEDMDGFNFTSIGKIKDKEPLSIKYEYKAKDVRNIGSGNDSTNSANPQRKTEEVERKEINSFTLVQNGANKFEMENEGAIASKCLVHDSTTKTVVEKEFSYLEDFKKSSKLEQKPMDPEQYLGEIPPETKFLYKTNSTKMFEGVEEQYDPFDKQKRISQILRNNSKVLKMDIVGNSDLKCGEVIKIEIPSAEFLEKKSDDPLDWKISHKFIIGSLGHTFIRNDGYHMSLELLKDSYIK